MNIIQFVSSLLLWIGSYVLLGAIYSLVKYLIKKESSSMIPIIGSLFIILGVYLHPNREIYAQFTPWIFFVILIDFGTLVMLYGLIKKRDSA